MRNGSCKFGAECKFNHPDPTTIGGTDSLSFHDNNGVSIGTFSPKSAFQAGSTSWTSPRHLNGTSPFIPVMLSQTHGVPSQTPEWNGYQVVCTSALDLNNIDFYSNYLWYWWLYLVFRIYLGFCVFIWKGCVFSFHHIPYEQFISWNKYVVTIPTSNACWRISRTPRPTWVQLLYENWGL